MAGVSWSWRIIVGFWIGVSGTVAAFPCAAAEGPTTPPAMVELNLPENMELKVLIDYVGKRLDLRFLYDEQVVGKRVTIKTPGPVPVTSLLTLLESALRMKGLALHAEPGGLVRIELARQLTASSVGPTTQPRPEARLGLAVTRVFELQHAAPTRVDEVIKPFLSTPSATTTPLAEHRLLIVTDYADNLPRLQELIALVDRPTRDVQVRLVPVQHQDAASVAQKVTQLLAGKARATGAAAGPTLVPDERANQVMMVGSAEDLAEASQLVASLDTPLGLETRTYTFSVASAGQVDRLLRDLIGEAAARRLYRSAGDTDANILIATATPDIHQQIQALALAMDKPAPETQSPIRFYRLENAKAVEIVATLTNIEGQSGLGANTADSAPGEARTPSLLDSGSADPGTAGAQPGRLSTARGAGASSAERTQRNRPATGGAAGMEALLAGGGSRVVADEPSNTVIVVARPAMQAVYEKLIRRLDVRRPQVLVEATVVALDTTNGFSLGVEFSSKADVNNGAFNALNFSSFGLSTPNPNTGQLVLRPGTGFNGVLLASDIAEVVIRALQTDSRAKVMSRPSVLINDNATGELVSESEEPFASVNASATVATTSFAGYSSAGTRIIITPQISEGEYLKLKYEVTLSSFGADRTSTLPPSRQTNALTSEVTIPDGHTIVVGGLTRETFQQSVDRIPVLGSLPGLEYLFSSRNTTTRQSTLFVFLRAVVLRSDKFEDLKVLSRESVVRAGVPGDLPVSTPLVME